MEVNPNFSVNALNDFHCVMKAKDGDQKAFAELMERYKDSIFFMAFKMTGNKDDAMDVTVETFAKAFESLDKYKPDYAFSTWLFRIATNNTIDFVRKKKFAMSIHAVSDRREEYALQVRSDGLNPEEDSIRKDQGNRLKFMMGKLPSKYQKLLKLRYYDDLSYEEIAVVFDCPIGTVKAQLFRAHNLMFAILKRKEQDINDDF